MNTTQVERSRRNNDSRIKRSFLLLGLLLVVTVLTGSTFAALTGAIYTTEMSGTIVNENVNYGLAMDVYLSGGPQNPKARGVPDGTYFFQVTDPSGKILLSTDNAVCRQLIDPPTRRRQIWPRFSISRISSPPAG